MPSRKIPHCNLVDLNIALIEKYNLSSNEVVLQLANITFDTSVEQIILAILNGSILLLTTSNLWVDNKSLKVLTNYWSNCSLIKSWFYHDLQNFV